MRLRFVDVELRGFLHRPSLAKLRQPTSGGRCWQVDARRRQAVGAARAVEWDVDQPRHPMNAPVRPAPHPATVDATLDLLEREDYIADRRLATAVFLSLRMARPLFLEGEAGRSEE